MKIWQRRSLRARLGLLFAALLIFSVGLVGLYSYWSVWQLFVSSKTSHLRALAKPVIEHWLVDNHLTQAGAAGDTMVARLKVYYDGIHILQDDPASQEMMFYGQ